MNLPNLLDNSGSVDDGRMRPSAMRARQQLRKKHSAGNHKQILVPGCTSCQFDVGVLLCSWARSPTDVPRGFAR